VASRGRRTEARSGETVDPGRDVDGKDGDTLGNGREVEGPTEARAVGSIDDEIDLDRQCGDVGLKHHASHATTLEPGGGGAAVGPVVALACDDRHPPSIGCGRFIIALVAIYVLGISDPLVAR